MKFIHCADLHLGSRMSTNLPSEKATALQKELMMSFSKMIDYAKENEIGLILIAGDMFDAEKVSKRAERYALSCIRGAAEIQFLYLKGNHDLAFDFSDVEECPGNLKFFDANKWTYFDFCDDKLVVAGIGNLSNQEAYDALVLDENKTNIVVLHGQDGMKTGKDSVNIRLLKNKNIDYLALGHIHTARTSKLDTRGFYAYSGCLFGRGFDECGEHGFMVVEADCEKLANKVQSEFVALPCEHKFETVEIDISGMTDEKIVEEAVSAATAEKESSSVIKCVLKGKINDSTIIDIPHLEMLLKDKFFYLKVTEETKIAIDPEMYKDDISLKGEFIRMVYASRMTAAQKEKVIRYGISALKGEEIN